eukprot:COSAG03_NODE_266_length_9692_cov_13.725216_8_plen_58_part_00
MSSLSSHAHEELRFLRRAYVYSLVRYLYRNDLRCNFKKGKKKKTAKERERCDGRGCL